MGGNVSKFPTRRAPLAYTQALIEDLLRQAPEMTPALRPWRGPLPRGATYSGVQVGSRRRANRKQRRKEK